MQSRFASPREQAMRPKSLIKYSTQPGAGTNSWFNRAQTSDFSAHSAGYLHTDKTDEIPAQPPDRRCKQKIIGAMTFNASQAFEPPR